MKQWSFDAYAGFAVGMTGDRVEDAPGLKKAGVGIAVHGSTGAARASADIVLTSPGLSTIITAIEVHPMVVLVFFVVLEGIAVVFVDAVLA